MNMTVKEISDLLKQEEINEQRQTLNCMKKQISHLESQLNCREILQNSTDMEL